MDLSFEDKLALISSIRHQLTKIKQKSFNTAVTPLYSNSTVDRPFSKSPTFTHTSELAAGLSATFLLFLLLLTGWCLNRKRNRSRRQDLEGWYSDYIHIK